MNYQIFSENCWTYPDTELTNPGNKAELFAARGSDVCFQVLTDKNLTGGEAFDIAVSGLECEPVSYQLMPAYVPENSDAKIFTTLDWESVKHFATRPAPFEVYDVTRPLDTKTLAEGRAAFYIRLNVAMDATPGVYDGKVTLSVDGESLELPVSLKVYKVQVPALENSVFHMANWLYYDRLAEQHNMEAYSDEYREMLAKYIVMQLDMRNDMLMIPAGTPIRDENGKVIDFDFTKAEFVGNLALELGFKYIMGGFVARFEQWDEPEQRLLWDRDVFTSELEGYRQLKIYFTRAWECVTRNNWQEHYMQCLVDEPQIPNSFSYRALSCICRQNMPGVKINDPVETPDIAGACDIYVVKQAVYEKYIEKFRALQATGETVMIYTCGFPGGATMNRAMDLPLTVSRLPMWMCYLYDAPGFLHWGFHYYNREHNGLVDGCIIASGTTDKFYTPGNAHVAYNMEKGVWYGIRAHQQRLGAYDYELFHQLGLRDKAKAKALVKKCCRTFDDYDGSWELFDNVRRELLEELG